MLQLTFMLLQLLGSQVDFFVDKNNGLDHKDKQKMVAIQRKDLDFKKLLFVGGHSQLASSQFCLCTGR
jgi:hypothetical protein